MASYKDVSTVLEAYRQLENGQSVSRMKAAAKRLRAFDPANELLSELDAKIEALDYAAQSIPLLHRPLAAEMLA